MGAYLQKEARKNASATGGVDSIRAGGISEGCAYFLSRVQRLLGWIWPGRPSTCAAGQAKGLNRLRKGFLRIDAIEDRQLTTGLLDDRRRRTKEFSRRTLS